MHSLATTLAVSLTCLLLEAIHVVGTVETASEQCLEDDTIQLLQTTKHLEVKDSGKQTVALSTDLRRAGVTKAAATSARKSDDLVVAELKVAAQWLWNWSPFVVCAVIYRWLYPPSAKSLGRTAAITGFRIFLAMSITLEHAGLHQMSGSGAFVILSGLVLSTSRRKAPGLATGAIDTVSGYCEFVWLRLTRLLPLYWFWLSVPWGVPNCTGGEHIYPSTPINNDQESFGNPLTFLLAVMNNSWAVVVHDPRSILLLYPPQTLGALWFVQTILVVYLFYPFLERIALGPQEEQPASSSRLVMVGITCCALKFGMGLWLAIDVDAVYGTSIFHVWKGISLYALPLLKIPDFMLGVLVPHFGAVSAKPQDGASSEKSEQGSAWKAWLPYVSDFVFALIIFYGYICPKSHRSVLLWDVNTGAPFWAFVMWGLCFGPQPSILGRIFSSPTLVAAGEWGYGMYLYHPPMLVIMSQYPHLLADIGMLVGYYPQTSWFGGFSEMEYKHWGLLAVIPVSLLMSWSTFVLIEVPYGEWARKVIGKRSSATPSPPGNPKPVEQVNSGG